MNCNKHLKLCGNSHNLQLAKVCYDGNFLNKRVRVKNILFYISLLDVIKKKNNEF